MKNYFFLIAGICMLASLSFVAKPANISDDVLQQTNAFRKANGLRKLVPNKYLNDIAQKHSDDMAKKKVGFGHGGFEKRNKIASSHIAGMRSFAENVAYGAQTGKQVVDMWKSSSGHRKNLLGNYSLIGIGVAKSSNGTLYYTQVFAEP